MRKILSIALPCFFVISCINSKRAATVHYQNKLEEESILGGNIYTIIVPKDYELVTLVGGHSELEKQYIYLDSSKLYITNFRSSELNYNNILLQGDSIAAKRLESIELKARLSSELNKVYAPDTILLQGKTKKNLYWKDLRIGYLSIGYVNVPENRKEEFDNSLNSFTKKR